METTSLSSSTSRLDRKIIERNRRNRMKFLYSKLKSLVDHQTTSTEMIATLPDQLEETVKYIKRLQMKLEKLRQRKERLVKLDEMGNNSSSSSNLQVQVEIREMMGDSVYLEVVVVVTTTEGEGPSMDQYSALLLPFGQAIQVLQQEFGAEVLNASYSTLDHDVFYTMHCKVGDIPPPGYGAARISQRLQKLFTNTTPCVDSNNMP